MGQNSNGWGLMLGARPSFKNFGISGHECREEEGTVTRDGWRGKRTRRKGTF